MAIVKSYKSCYGKAYIDVEVDEGFAAHYADIVHQEKLINRKETRRHQSLDKSMEKGWDVADKYVNIEEEILRNEENKMLYSAMILLTDKQKITLILYAVEGWSFRKIGDKLGISKETVREHYLAAVNKMKKLLQ